MPIKILFKKRCGFFNNRFTKLSKIKKFIYDKQTSAYYIFKTICVKLI